MRCTNQVARPLLLIILSMLTAAAPLTSTSSELPDAEEIRRLVRGSAYEALARYREFLTLPNDANYPDDILRLVDWLEPQFSDRGFETRRIGSGRNPFLFAAKPGRDSRTTVLVYLQADGQPVDPSAWHQEDPYTPVMKARDDSGAWERIPWPADGDDIDEDARVFARSAADSKGPMAQFFAALDILDQLGIETGFDLKVIVDTEEEQGSPSLPAAVREHADLLAADMLLIFDGPPHASNNPTVSFGARGIARVTLTVYGPRVPQHSGHYGNFIPNPVFHLSRILASLKSPDGRVMLPGFYDGISLDAETRRHLAAVPDDENAILRHAGVARADSVALSLQQALQFPSLNVRGLAAAWVGEEARTIIPATATAEIDIRLVKESDPQRLIGIVGSSRSEAASPITAVRITEWPASTATLA